MKSSKQTAIYVRVSSKTQDTAAQEADLKAWAASREGARWYRDTFTGKTMDRPGWAKLEADIRAGKVGVVVVWRLDRLGRTAKGLTALFDELRAKGVNLVSLRDGLDLSTPAGRLMANVLASVAQYETEGRSERQMAGIAAAKDRGVRFGRPEGIRTRIKVTLEQDAAVRRLASEGQGKAAIARATGLSRPTIYSILAASAVG
jgi:DNA invertase Pin-like site-specific DNA recombinase